MASELFPQPPQGTVDLFPGAVEPLLAKVVEDGLPRREFSWEHAPLAATLEQVEDGVKDRSPAVEPRPSTSPGARQVRFEERPLGV
jgi:hypothetical protein